jgi:16S rRNA (adenine1518-N6/adenine1519-N6)-dimethyltransferase
MSFPPRGGGCNPNAINRERISSRSASDPGENRPGRAKVATRRVDPGRRGDRPRYRRSLGQHHLRDGAAAAPLVGWLRPRGSSVVEIGAGGGALTEQLVGAGAVRVVALELDLGWALTARRRLAPDPPRPPHGPIRWVVADALEIDWRGLPSGWSVAGNLPYQVGTAILERLVASAPVGTRCGFLLQREVVDRLVAAPGSRDYGALSVLVAARASVRRLGTLGPGAFVPPPKVSSSFVGLELRAAPLPEGRMAGLERVVRAAFGQRRKTLRNAVGAVYGRARAEAALAAVGIDPGTRAERLGLAEFLELERELEGRPAAG